MCIVVCMKKRLPKQMILKLQDMGTAAEYQALPLDKRVQVKMPSSVVASLDQLFPDTDRSQVITRFVLDALVRHLRFSADEELSLLANDEQTQLDTLWEYLEHREQHV